MQAKDLQHSIEALGLSQMELGRFVGVDGRTVRNWASGRRPVPEAVSKLLRLMLALKLSPSDVRGLVNE